MSNTGAVPSPEERPLVRFRRRGGMPPPDWEVLEITVGGAFRLWRSVMRPSVGSGWAGRFIGTLPGDGLRALTHALSGCTGSTGASGPPPADSSIDTFRCEGGELTIPADASAPPAWQQATTLLRGFLDSLTGHPLAAIGLDFHEGARMVHAGSAPLELDLSNGTVRVIHRDGDAIAGQWSAPLGGPRTEIADPGWSLLLPFAHGFPEGARLTVSVDGFLAFDSEFWRACGLQANTLAP